MSTALQERIGLDVIDAERHNELAIAGSSGNDLAWRFFELGRLRGKTAGEIIAAVGMPTSRSAMANGQALLRWQARGYHMALLFDAEDRVMKVTTHLALSSRRY